ncbi:PREDICTED: uncharacterized protein LOC109217751 [Nicotiana attenuata]|uniref:uncharacterized protein LOC109217751 n=1 Tax=Nicotiana attenuata TaxID=49451 RepID=UPI000904E935|nr:PREDICTED: uncharacterized protein LOC109217751 [Nicotiana attenuata]
MDITRPLPGSIKLHDPKGKTDKEEGQQVNNQKLKQEWRIIRVLDPKVDKIDAHGRYLEQIEPDGEVVPRQQGKEEEWQVARGKLASKKEMEINREEEVYIGNAFKALVDTAQKIVQMSEAHRTRGQRRRNEVLIAIVENKVQANKAEAIIRKVFGNWQWTVNYDEAPGGRIWIIWDQTKAEFEVKQIHEQYIAGQVVLRQCNTKFIFVAVYGKHSIQDSKSLWTDSERTMSGIQDPNLTMGDFNSILSTENRVMGNPVREGEVIDFKRFIADVGLAELKTIGRNYTWTNNHVHSRIDIILANAEWVQKWPNMEGTIMQPGFSDHCPLMVTVAEPTERGKRPLKFFNCLASHHKFDDIVRECWMKGNKGNPMLKVWYKLKQLEKELKQLNNEEYTPVWGQRSK